MMNLCYNERHSNSAYTNITGVKRYTTAICSIGMNHNMTQIFTCFHINVWWCNVRL